MSKHLLHQIESYDILHMQKLTAALQLLPVNMRKSLTLECISHYTATLPYSPNKPEISVSKLKWIASNLKKVGLKHIDKKQDPPENLFTESFHFIGGGYVVFPGRMENIPFILNGLLQAIDKDERLNPSSDFVREVKDLAISVLLISDSMARKANLKYGTFPTSNVEQDLQVPEEAVLARLYSAVTFSYKELEQQLAKWKIPISVLDKLIIQTGETASNYTPTSSVLFTKPIVQYADSMIVALPHMLLFAMRYHILESAHAHGYLPYLSDFVSKVMWSEAKKALNILGSEYIGEYEDYRTDETAIKEGLFSLDQDKIVHAFLVTESVDNYTPEKVFDHFIMDKTSQYIQEKITSLKQESCVSANSVTGIFYIIIVQSLGGQCRFVLKTSNSDTLLIISLTSLKTISEIEQGEILKLYKYAKAKKQLHKTKLLIWDELDLYQMFRENNYSFNVKGNGIPDAIALRPDTGLMMKCEAFAKTRKHAAPFYTGNRTVNVTAVYKDKPAPIFIVDEPTAVMEESISFCIEICEKTIWIVQKSEYEEQEYPLIPTYLEIIKMIANWLWLSETALQPYLNTIATDLIIINIELTPAFLSPNCEVHTVLPLSVIHEENTITLTFSPTVIDWFKQNHNQGERQIMREVFTSIIQMSIEYTTNSSITVEEQVNSIVDQIIPFGFMKNIIAFSDDISEKLGIGLLGRYRSVQPIDESRIDDEIGEFILKGLKIKPGPVKNAQKQELLKDIVAYLYQKIQDEISKLSLDGLLEWFIYHNECITKDRMNNDISLPVHSLLYDDKYKMERIKRELNEINRAGMAIRFLIEYIAAVPPAGKSMISLEIHDKLMALASTLISLANESNYVKFGLAHIEILITPSGRMDIQKKEYLAQSLAYSNKLAENFIYKGLQNLRKNAPGDNEHTINDKDEMFEAAIKAEFGVTATELFQVIAILLEQAIQADVPILYMEENKLKQKIMETYEIKEEVINTVFLLLSLEERKDFMTPPVPFKTQDVEPWGFNRQLSFIRKPLIRIKSHILCGYNHTYSSIFFLMELISNGMLKANSQEMKNLMSWFTKKHGEEFNEQVALEFEKLDKTIVEKQINKVNKKKIIGKKGI